MNVMSVTKLWFALICASGTTYIFQSGNMIIICTQCCIFITENTLIFKIAKVLKLCENYSCYHMAHAELV